jgi:hypothetical protein
MDYIWSSGLGRVIDQMNKSNASFISAFRDFRTKEENLALTKELKVVIRNKGFEYIPMQGEWKEDVDSIWKRMGSVLMIFYHLHKKSNRLIFSHLFFSFIT